MAEYNENLIKFGWLTRAELDQAISEGKLNEFDICFSNDTHEQFIIDADLNPIPIKSRVRVYGSAEAALEDIQSTPQSYAGEVISVKDGEKFIAYVVNQFANGDWYISPVYSDSQINYNEIQNTPIKNISGTISEPVVLKDLADGQYKVTGTFICPNNETVTSIVGNLIIIDTTNVNTKTIKRISNISIYDYTIINNNVTIDRYATESFVESKGYATNAEVDLKLEAFKISMQEYIEEYVETTVSLLIKYLIDQELDSRYSSKEDIENLFN